MNRAAETKEVTCSTQGCESKFNVFKWSANKQKCDKCKGNSKNTTNEDTLVSASNMVLTSNNFIIGSHGWYKQYSGTNVIYQLEPKFDKGTFVDKRYDVIGFIVHKQEYIHADDVKNIDNLPAEMLSDMTRIVSKLSKYVVQKSTNAIDKVKCDMCNDKVSEWIEIEQQYICIKKCLMKKMKR